MKHPTLLYLLTISFCHGAGGAVRTQVSKGSGRAGGRANGRVASGRSVGRAGRCGSAAALGGWFTFGRAAEREREIYSYGEIDRRLSGEERVLSTRPPLYGIRRALDRARASPGHLHLSIYRNADPLGRVTGQDSRVRHNKRDRRAIHRPIFCT